MRSNSPWTTAARACRRAERERVLDRFYRSGETQAPGSGLGLAIVKSIAELHGASVTLDASPSLGGLRVRVVFASRSCILGTGRERAGLKRGRCLSGA
jgi:hypothetical protein